MMCAAAAAVILFRSATVFHALAGDDRFDEASQVLVEDVIAALGDSRSKCERVLAGLPFDPGRSPPARIPSIALYDFEGVFVRDVVKAGRPTRLKGIMLKELKLLPVAEANGSESVADLHFTFVRSGWWRDETLVRRLPLSIRHAAGVVQTCSLNEPVSAAAVED